MTIYKDYRFPEKLIGGTLSRDFGNMCNPVNQELAFQKLGINPNKILHFKQTHSDTFITIRNEQEALAFQKKPLVEADAWIMGCSNWGCMIQTADCVPLFMWDSETNFFALAHCGWRGVVKELPYKVAMSMQKIGATLPISVWVGPHIQSCCFEVQEDVASQFATYTHKTINSQTHIDLNKEILHQLQKANILENNIRFSTACTVDDKRQFFSWRRDHERRNLLSFLYKK